MKSLRKLCTLATLVTSVGVFAQTAQVAGVTPTANVRNRATVSFPSATPGSNLQSATIQFPQGTRTETVKAKLNGKDVSAKFSATPCSGKVCLTAQFGSEDGVIDGHNTLFATAKNQDGTASSTRAHFVSGAASATSQGLHALAASTDVTASSLPTYSSFLPPSITFSTLVSGGPGGSQNWFQLGTKTSSVLASGSCASSSMYSVILVDRRTLTQSGTSQCYNDGGSLASALQSLANATPAANDLVIVGTNYGQNTDAGNAMAQLNTSAIGGRAYNCAPSNSGSTCAGGPLGTSNDVPQGYLAIGVLNGKPGSAFEYYKTNGSSIPNTFATGMLVQDANGNYNFQSSNNVEYTVQPGTAQQSAQIRIMNAPSLPGQTAIYTPPSGSNGFWVLIMDRGSLSTSPACSGSGSGQNITFANCGTFYPLGANGGPIDMIGQMAQTLQAVRSDQVVFLTTVGTAGWGDATTMASDNNTPNNTIPLANALGSLGIPDKSILYTGATNSTYTFVASPAFGNPVSGHDVLSSSYFTQQGHSGYVHGTLARDSYGLYEPAHTEQQQAATDTADLQLGLINSQQPQEWPEFVTALATGNTLTGQTQAYQYLSYYLLNQWYVAGQLNSSGAAQPGVTGTYAYDIHYFFTGSLNTLLDYHTYDPTNAVYPGASWTSPDGTTLSFTQQEFNSVKYQLHNEIVDLTNVLTYFVTGSTNLKDLVAAGNANAALSLIQASSEIQANLEASQIQAQTTTPATLSPWHIMHMIASDVSPYVSFATDGVVNPEDIALANKAIGFVSDLFSAAGSTGGGLSSGDQSAQKEIPRLDYRLDTTIGQIAGSDLQGQFLAGFDSTLDSITGDWGKLNALGGQSITQSPLFAPTQATQNQVIQMITKASQKSLYVSLIPQIYQAHKWGMYGQTATADMGYTSNGDTNSCKAFYDNTTTAWVAVWYPTYGGTSYWESWKTVNNNPDFPFKYVENAPFYDWYVLSLPFTSQGGSGARATAMDANMSNILFGNSSNSVNFVRDEFVAGRGPMNVRITDGGNSEFDLAFEWDSDNPINKNFSPDTNAIGIHTANVCSVSQFNGVSATAPTSQDTVTTLTVPGSSVLGIDVTYSAKITKTIGTGVPAGFVEFRDNDKTVANVALDGTGSASYTAKGLVLGSHGITAYYLPSDGSQPSNSVASTLMVYANTPDMTLALSQSSLNVTYGTTSSPVTLKVQALSGMAGAVNYACSGLPAGMTCSFSPPSNTVTDGGTASTTFTISGSVLTATSGFGTVKGWAIVLISLPLLLVTTLRKTATRGRLLCSLLLMMVTAGSLVGCGGNSTPAPSTVKDTGTKTVLVTATGAGVTRTIPLSVTVQ